MATATAVRPSLSGAAFGETNLVPAEVLETLEAIAEALNPDSYADRSFYLDDEDVEDRRLALRGGFWNARDLTRVADGITKADATAARKALRELGFDVSFDEADALLSQVVRGELEAIVDAIVEDAFAGDELAQVAAVDVVAVAEAIVAEALTSRTTYANVSVWTHSTSSAPSVRCRHPRSVRSSRSSSSSSSRTRPSARRSARGDP